MEEVSKKRAKRLEKKRERSEKKAQSVADGTWTNPRKRRNQRDFHCETRDSVDDMANETTSETKPDGFRYVAPYKHKFQVHVKARWFGKTLLQMFVEEFGGYSSEYYAAAIQHGFITINHLPTTASTLVKHGDLLQHVMHRHEPRVQAFDAATMVAFQSDDIVVVNKPSTIPVHPCGAYRHNSLVFILANDLHLHPVFPVHRLDRLTSGLLVLAKSADKAAELSAQLVERSVQKFYFAKVLGRFPSVAHVPPAIAAAAEVDAAVPSPAASPSSTSLSSFPFHDLPPHCTVTTAELDGHAYFHISAPLGRIADLENRHGIVATGKPSQTLVRWVGESADGRHSVLHCLPLTGRQHQIRVHLQAVGFPIANDPLYGPPTFVDTIVVEASRRPMASTNDTRDVAASHDPATVTAEQLAAVCESCQMGDHVTFNWEQQHCQGIYLHAFRYKVRLESKIYIYFL
ncbi:hypothetical protein, variant 1 [Aphanomyces astaci]|uniref:Pseudouridine synthase RsuA/RluA-like domain-containing protein n=1 Tax=Aphanomyces astaci TaxID=112090 RepID=W4GKS4_APHAT|nr:hypothetical protein, variant 1 [Aphanomyces astaci]ETV79503.1 hypothetical protein, variant 1 [Aphanomyces astaci]|eukprot:XP_009831345.1 hypothetical protein, variant 1 [Aphanomyces astaci]